MRCLIIFIIWLPAAGSAEEPDNKFSTQLRPDLYLSACDFEYYLGFHRDITMNQNSLFGAGGNVAEFNVFFTRSPLGFGGRLAEVTTSNEFFRWNFPFYYYLSMLAPYLTYTTRYATNSFDLITLSGCYLTDVWSIAVEYRRVIFPEFIPTLINTEIKIRAAYFSYTDTSPRPMNGISVGVGIKIGLGYWGVTRIPVLNK